MHTTGLFFTLTGCQAPREEVLCLLKFSNNNHCRMKLENSAKFLLPIMLMSSRINIHKFRCLWVACIDFVYLDSFYGWDCMHKDLWVWINSISSLIEVLWCKLHIPKSKSIKDKTKVHKIATEEVSLFILFFNLWFFLGTLPGFNLF